ncbi:MAG: lipooligosaccharide sialyltransferase [Lachnospiraceae bacterium]|nr:lipooligosaccharide sialyltransferase [Lachnospiraceae bacterium]
MAESSRIYICHTFYHVYIACLKEFYLNDLGHADLILSKMSNRFGSMVDRAEKCPVFNSVYEFDEKEYTQFPDLVKLKENSGNIAGNMLRRIKFCKKLARHTEPLIPVDLKKYKDIYVFCDSDPIGYYLNYKKIRYHAVEDGLDCIAAYDTARYDNRGAFRIKALMAKLGLIHIQNGYGRYCIDMEVNDLSKLKYTTKNMVELPRSILTERLKSSEKEILLDLFIENIDELRKKLNTSSGKPTLLVLTEPLCDLETRERIFKDIIESYHIIDGKEATVLLKQHPRDLLDYKKLFPDAVLLDGTFPMEMLNFIDGLVFDRLVSVYTRLDAIRFAKEKILLYDDFMDKYEAPEIHRQNEAI